MRHIRAAPSTTTAGPVLDFDTFFRTEYQRLFETLYLVVRNRAEAEDLAQESMARTYERWDKVRDPVGYVYRTAFNLHRSWLRRLAVAAKKLREPLQEDDPDAVERRLDVLQALSELPQTQQVALVLVDWVGMTAEEAGRVLAIRPVSVRGRVHRARAALRRRLGGDDG
jgi:RNA polymerase sigma factor (sigma-70 family)